MIGSVLRWLFRKEVAAMAKEAAKEAAKKLLRDYKYDKVQTRASIITKIGELRGELVGKLDVIKQDLEAVEQKVMDLRHHTVPNVKTDIALLKDRVTEQEKITVEALAEMSRVEVLWVEQEKTREEIQAEVEEEVFRVFDPEKHVLPLP